MTSRYKQPRRPGDVPPAGEATTPPGRAGHATPPHPPARALFPVCVCGHISVLHGLAQDGRTRTACSHHAGPKAAPCGCRRFEPLNQEAAEDSS